MERQRTGLTFDEMLDAVGDVERRKLLAELFERSPESDSPVIAVDGGLIEHSVQMCHIHLPKLEEYGVVDWEREAHEVTRGRNFGEVTPVLELADEYEEHCSGSYL